MCAYCPRCESPLATREASCHVCGHQWHIRCGACGKLNVPQAVFCGECGRAISWRDRIRQKHEELFSYVSRSRLRNLGAGLAFGTLFAVFAFGSMGMSSPGSAKIIPEYEMAGPADGILDTGFGRKASARLRGFLKQDQSGRRITQGDLIRVGNMLIDAFSPAIHPERPVSGLNTADSRKYLQTLESDQMSPSDEPVTRSDVAMFFFRFVSDMFEVPPVEESTYKYADIPRYHFMNLPVETLDMIGLHLSREDNVFGGDDAVTLSWLSKLSVDLVKACEGRLKNVAFSSLEVQ
ncbi:MAG: zinc ribbon domain-containing protein [Candidatus Riflebacteria bacterium]|nr:zinc ribbon domain-containing protein [Candidatus Riflebacteria bacterium]